MTNMNVMHCEVPACLNRPVRRQLSGIWNAFSTVIIGGIAVGGLATLLAGSTALSFVFPAFGLVINPLYIVLAVFGLGRVLFWFFPTLDGSRGMNLLSAPSNKDFLAYVFDMVFGQNSSEPSVVYDIGGVGQIKPGMDPRGRVSKVINVNQKKLPTTDMMSIDDAAAESGDLCVMSGVIEYFQKGADVAFLRQVRGVLKPSGYVMVCDTEFHPWPLFEPIVRAVQTLATVFLMWSRFSYRSAEQVVQALKDAGYSDVQLLPRRYVPWHALGSAFVVLARK